MKRESKAERDAWTAYFDAQEGKPIDHGKAIRKSKYGNVKTNGFDSKREAECAAKLEALESRGLIKNLDYQVRFVLVPGNGKIRPICYFADFVYCDLDGTKHILDTKGYAKDKVYRLKKKMMQLLHGLEIEEI